jgi:hypothetical protein
VAFATVLLTHVASGIQICTLKRHDTRPKKRDYLTRYGAVSVRQRRFFMTEAADLPRRGRYSAGDSFVVFVLVIRATKKMAESARTPPFLLEHGYLRAKAARGNCIGASIRWT